MGNLRRVEPIGAYLPSELPKSLDPGKPPELRWVAPTDLYVDADYQRNLRKRSFALITRILHGFQWNRLKPPVCVEVDGLLHCIDGQHTAIAAATLSVRTGLLDMIPVLVVEADTQEARAAAFVGHNRDRIVMDQLDVYRGLLRAQDPDAIDIDNVCRRAGITIKQIQRTVKLYPGDCCALGAIAGLIKRHSPMKARMVLEALVKGGRAPVTRYEIDACEAMMLVKFPNLSVEQMMRVVATCGDKAVIQSRVYAASERRPQKYLLYEAYLTVLNKQLGNVQENATHIQGVR